ncbi:hypothetical protein O7543_03730 [Solwaraspora sp. WMMA2080]|uniref:hypothetical protein n=1 Tax=unclassified Solwaraspora TaxID=2627926 RepID=UPI00248CA7BF|nr:MULTISPECIES: hypothetical protein [unclassified Solwaraspora]WBB99845.1 hypothetical protein O7553_13640 [Solwaraspora sp. WMMA2059]WBC21607.1 hypothetical protein O7543_03730 [Solwaraspora sp. WMMA2080]
MTAIKIIATYGYRLASVSSALVRVVHRTASTAGTAEQYGDRFDDTMLSGGETDSDGQQHPGDRVDGDG